MTAALYLSLLLFLGVQTPADDCDCDAQRPVVLAVVDGINVKTADVEQEAAPLVGPIKDEMDQARAQALENLVRKTLVDLEARRRGMSTNEFLQKEVFARIAEPTERELQNFYEQNQSSINVSYEESRERLRQYFRSQRQEVELTLLVGDLRSTGQVQVLDPSPKAPKSSSDLARVLARINGTEIKLSDVEDALRSLFYGYRKQIYEVERQIVEARIDDVVLEREATRRKTSLDALVAAEVTPKVRKVDAFDAAKFYNDNKDRFGGRSLGDVKEDLLEYLRGVETAKATHEFALSLRKGASIQMYLVEPAPPTFQIDVAGRATKGNPAAPVTIIEFSDFQCPKCATLFAGLDDLVKTYGDRVRLVFRHYPLEQHPYAHRAAQAAEAAREQGKYWEYASLVFANQGSLSDQKLKELATQLGLDRARFDAALDAGKFAPMIERDLDDGARIGISGTPAVFVNGRAVADNSVPGVKAAVEAALAESK